MTSDSIHIYSMIIRDGDSGEIMCDYSWDEENSVEIPIKVLSCEAVSREMIFHSKKKINNLTVVQRVMIEQNIPSQDGDRAKYICLEEWVFSFGFVIPGSTNSWQSVVLSAKDEKGNVISSSKDMRGVEFVIETNFYDDKKFICKKSVQVRYV